MPVTTEYYLTIDNKLVDVRKLAPSAHADEIIGDLEAMTDDRPANTDACSVFFSHLTPARPGPLDADTVKDAAGGADSIELLQVLDPADGVTSYYLPQRGALMTVEDFVGGMELQEFHDLADALDDHFYDRHGERTPAQVFMLPVDEARTQNAGYISEATRAFISTQMPHARRGVLTFLQWTE